MARGRSDKIALFASPPELATEIGIRSTFNVIRENLFSTQKKQSSLRVTNSVQKNLLMK